MHLSRRAFTGGALGAALASQLSLPAFAQTPGIAAALTAIRAYAERHRSFFNLPGMTLGVTMPGGFATVIDVGYANLDARTAITPDTLFQVGSISKVMTAALIHQLAAEGRLRLTDRLSDLLPEIPLPPGNTIQVHHLLDHIAGLPADAPLFPEGGLWTAYAPGAHWHYSNTAYDMLGKMVEQIAGKPLARLLPERLFEPLGMNRSRGAIVGADRLLYAQGYGAADPSWFFARGTPLAPAGWVDVTFAAGNVASTADDMNRFLRSLADAVQGRGGLGLAPDKARAFTTHAVASDTPGMRYGNGLMHVAKNGRSYLHHTGGMVSFSSSMHLDIASGVGAFASSTLNSQAEYRPRQVTQFAVDALTAASEGRPLPAPPRLDLLLPNPAAYIGRYAGQGGAFEVRSGDPLTIVTSTGGEAQLQAWGGETFRTTHPEFRNFSLIFERTRGSITQAIWGPETFLRQGVEGALPTSDPALARFAGRYVSDSPWMGTVPIVERGGRLWIGTETPLVRIAENVYRIGVEPWSPERGTFANFLGGRPQSFIFSGEKFIRHDV